MYSFPNFESVCCSMSSSTVAFWPAYRFLKRQIRWSGIPISWRLFQFVVVHKVKGFGIGNISEIDVFLELLLFQWSSGCWQFDLWFSAFSKSSLNIWKFLVHILLKPGLDNFEYYFANVWGKCNFAVVEHSLVLSILGIGMNADLFQSYGPCWVFQICWHIECSTFTESSIRIWNSSTGIPSLLLALFVVMLPKAHLTSDSRCLALGEWSHHCGYLDYEDLFCIALLYSLATS